MKETRRRSPGAGKARGRRRGAAQDLALLPAYRFFAAFGHELRSPLNVILCLNDLLAAGVLGALTDRQSDAVLRVSAASRRLRDIVDDLFEIGDLESGASVVGPEPVELRALAATVLERLRPEAEQRGLYLRLEGGEGLRLHTDRAKVERILLKLGVRALNFTARGGVTIRLAAGDGGVRIEIADTGPGDDPGDLDRGIEEIGTLPPAQARCALGLAIAARLAALLGGGLAVECRPGEGTTFSLFLPARISAS